MARPSSPSPSPSRLLPRAAARLVAALLAAALAVLAPAIAEAAVATLLPAAAAADASGARTTTAKRTGKRAGKRAGKRSARRAGKRTTQRSRRAAKRTGTRGAKRTRARRVRATPPLLSIDGATLRGSRQAVDDAYEAAQRRGLAFAGSRREVERAAAEGEYVRLTGGRNYRLKGVGVPYARPATRAFLDGFGARYRTACGEPLTVTSALRPTSVRLPNSVEKTVHPTGMAVDLRAPRAGRCRDWLRRSLLALEADGAIDATEERRPPHFHVVVLRAP